MSNSERKLRVGLIGLGLAAYWDQFAGLQERLRGYVAVVEQKIASDSRTVINLGLVDSARQATEVGHACRRQDIDLLTAYVTTYSLSATILPVILRAKVPVLFLNLQPAARIDYDKVNRMVDRTAMTGEWLAYCNACPVPELANVFRRLDIPFQQVTGVLHDDPACWAEVEQWLRSAEVVHSLSHTRLGLMGHYYSGMLDVSTNLVEVSGRFGIQVEFLEVEELSALRRHVSDTSLSSKIRSIREFFDLDQDCSQAELERAAKTSIALDLLVCKHELGMMAYYCKGTGIVENEDTMSSIILGTSMLTGSGIPVAGEYEIKNVIAMKILDLLGIGGSFTEYYAIDFADDLVLMGHDGPGHIGIAQGKIRVRPLRVYHGKLGSGLSVEMSVRNGPVTLLSIVEDKERGFLLLAAEGESVAGEILEIGNTNSRYKFPLGARRFVEEWSSAGPAHHCAIGVGHNAAILKKIALLLGMPFRQVC